MTTQGEIEHYQDQVKKLLAAKNQRLDDLKEINSRLAKLGFNSNSASTKRITPKKNTVPKNESPPKNTTIKQTTSNTSKKITPVATTKGQIKIVATVKNMKAFLTSQGIKYPSQAKKAELDKIIRQKCLVKRMNDYQEKHG